MVLRPEVRWVKCSTAPRVRHAKVLQHFDLLHVFALQSITIKETCRRPTLPLVQPSPMVNVGASGGSDPR